MKKLLVAVAALCLGSVALAGPNAGGTILLHDAVMVYTTDILDYCGMGEPLSICEQADTHIDDDGYSFVAQVFKAYAAFMGSPRLKGMTFGVNYPANLVVVAQGPCIGDPNNGAAEFADANWPASDSGTSIVFEVTQTSNLVEFYWFAAYRYYGDPGCFNLRDNPDPVLGGNFADDSVPAVQDAIAGYGQMGFGMMCDYACPQEAPMGACCIDTECTITTEAGCNGEWLGPDIPCDPNPCLPPPPEGACCFDEDCVILTEEDCMRQGGEYQGDDEPCDPNPCIIIPVDNTSWGQIKANYR